MPACECGRCCWWWCVRVCVKLCIRASDMEAVRFVYVSDDVCSTRYYECPWNDVAHCFVMSLIIIYGLLKHSSQYVYGACRTDVRRTSTRTDTACTTCNGEKIDPFLRNIRKQNVIVRSALFSLCFGAMDFNTQRRSERERKRDDDVECVTTNPNWIHCAVPFKVNYCKNHIDCDCTTNLVSKILLQMIHSTAETEWKKQVTTREHVKSDCRYKTISWKTNENIAI